MHLIIRIVLSVVLAGLSLAALRVLHDLGPVAEGIALFAIILLATFVNPKIKPKPAPGAKPAKPAKAAKTKRSSSKGKSTGTVKWFNVSKGYGFINCDDGQEIFVHFRSIEGEGRRSLRDGQKVQFLITQGDKGPQAESVDTLD